MPGCAAIGCNNRSEKGYTMKCFPRNPRLRKIWTEKVARADWEPSKNSFLCHVHFEADQWTITQSGRIKLKKNAIPAIFTVTSTRKSPRKRRKLINGEEEDVYIIEYLDDPTNRKSVPIAQGATYNSYTTSNITTIIGRPAYTRSSCRTATKILMEKRASNDTIVLSDEKSDEDTKRANGIVRARKVIEKIEKTRIKTEMKSRIDSSREIDEIEEKLRSICDGEEQIDDKMKNEKYDKSESINGKNTSVECNIDEKYKPKCLNIAKNGDHVNNRESSDDGDANERKKRSKIEITRDADEKFHVAENNSIDEAKCPLENIEKPCRSELSSKRPTFTIKLTGNEEDVTDIVEILGSEPILKYKISDEPSSGNKNFITSVISVTDTFRIKSENDAEEAKPKLEDTSSNDIKNEASLRINGNNEKEKEEEEEEEEEEEDNSMKLFVESPDDDENMMDRKRLRKKIKFQDEVIRKLTIKLGVDGPNEKMENHANARSDTKRRRITEKLCNGDCQNDRKDAIIENLSSKIKDSHETIARIARSLGEERQNAKNAQLQIRQRDNHIKELNWKLNKASKYIERAEKNANTYRKKLSSLQKLTNLEKLRASLPRQNREPSDNEASACMINMEESIVPVRESMKTTTRTNSIDANRIERFENPEGSSERMICRTVQDIFEESNRCDDDDPFIIENAEDFMRLFAGSL